MIDALKHVLGKEDREKLKKLSPQLLKPASEHSRIGPNYLDPNKVRNQELLQLAASNRNRNKMVRDAVETAEKGKQPPQKARIPAQPTHVDILNSILEGNKGFMERMGDFQPQQPVPNQNQPAPMQHSSDALTQKLMTEADNSDDEEIRVSSANKYSGQEEQAEFSPQKEDTWASG